MNNFANLNNAVALLRGTTQAAQTKFSEKRLARFQKALQTKPVFIPLQYKLNAEGATSPYDGDTPPQPFPIIITSIMSDNPKRLIEIIESGRNLPYVHGGDNRTLKLSLGDVGSRPAAGAEYAAVGRFDLPGPILLEAANRLTINVYKIEDTEEDEVLNIVLCGYRVFNVTGFDKIQTPLISKALTIRKTPRTTFLKQQISFDATSGKTGIIYTPPSDEPLIIKGVRSSLQFSTIELNLEGESKLTLKATPIWALAAYEKDVVEPYRAFQLPIFLPAKSTIEMELVNTIDGILKDDLTGQTITWICETV